jgi:hypothetical protein
MFRILFLLLLILAASNTKAQEFRYPKIEVAAISWYEVNATLARLQPEIDCHPEEKQLEDRSLEIINRAISSIFPWAAQSAVPLLLPVDVNAYIQNRLSSPEAKPINAYFLGGVSSIDAMDVGIAGYDVLFSKEAAGTQRTVTLSANVLLYEVPDVQLQKAASVIPAFGGELEIDSYILEDEQRLSFKKYGVYYVLSIPCAQSPKSEHRCEAERDLLLDLAKSLRFAGLERSIAPYETKQGLVPRPEGDYSPDFKFHPPGDLENGSGAGRTDYTIYASLRFPLRDSPAFANSQVFGDGGNCLNTKLNLSGDVPSEPFVPFRETYPCDRMKRKLSNDEGGARNYGYPWRDNFCEERDWSIPVCPNGMGHQGQDIRPKTCHYIAWQAAHDAPPIQKCEPYREEVVAAARGVIYRVKDAQALYLFVNSSSERFKGRYLHMNPEAMNRDGLIARKLVKEGEILGKAGNYLDYPFGTTSHLHFELMVPTREGWVHVDPYSSLIVSYEWLIGQRGREIPWGQ